MDYKPRSVRIRLKRKCKRTQELIKELNRASFPYLSDEEVAHAKSQPEVQAALLQRTCSERFFIALHFAQQYCPLAFERAIQLREAHERALAEYEAKVMRILSWSMTYRQALYDRTGQPYHVKKLTRHHIYFYELESQRYTKRSIHSLFNFKSYEHLLDSFSTLQVYLPSSLAALTLSYVLGS